MQNMKISNLIKLIILDHEVQIIRESIYRIKNLTDIQIDFLKRLKKGIPLKELDEEFKKKGISEIYNIFNDQKWLLKENPKNEYKINKKTAGYLESFTNDPWNAQIKLKNARVCIVGVGGVGSVVLENLVATEIENYILVDCDFIEASNLNRQFIFTRKDIKNAKVASAKKYILDRIPYAKVTGFQKKISNINDLEFLKEERIDILICAADSPLNISSILFDFCKSARIAFTSASIGIETGEWGPLICPNRSESADYYSEIINNLTDVERNFFEQGCINPYSFGPSNSIISTFMARDVILYLIGAKNIPSLGKRIRLDFKKLNIEPY